MRNVFYVCALLFAFSFALPGVASARTMVAGVSGSDVTALQQALSTKGYLSATATGYFGPATLAAVKKFQCAQGIVCSGSSYGIAGPQTQAALFGAGSSGSAPAPSGTTAASGTLEFSGWIPYWREATGTADALAHIDQLKEINPFGYIVQNDGTLMDPMGIADEPWKTLIATAKAKGVRVVPTVMWSNTAAIHTILSNSKSRVALEDAIAELVVREGFDGIDIDFEGKRAEDRDYFSTFLKGLYQRMGNKWVMCTIESRTPISDLYYGGTVPAGAGTYANDFVEINKYCDRVRFMTYDQQTAIGSLNAAAAQKGEVYGPVADTAWVEKAINEAAKVIKKSKIVIGVATYGYEWDVTAYADGYTYDLLWTFNPAYALPIAAQYGVTPVRGSSGELSFSYKLNAAQSTGQNSGNAVIPGVPVASASTILPGDSVAAAALASAKANNSNSTFRYMTWSDAQAIKEKVDLARKLGVRGVAVFKLDGGEDPAMWNVLK